MYALLEEGQQYLIEVTKKGYSSQKGTVNLTVAYDYGSNNTEEFTVPASYDARYYEKVCALHGTAEQYYYVTFEAGGYKTFQTFGNSDTELELYSIPYQNGTRLLRRDDNSGYDRNALISYNVETNVKYLLIVKLHGNNHTQYGQVKTTITPYNGYISSYNSFSQYTIPYNNSFDLSFNLEKGFSKAILVKTSNSGNYTFDLKSTNGDSIIDTYLHVIDSSRSAKKVPDVDYNDDGGKGRNSRITRALEANKYYYVVVSGYYLSTASGYVTLSIVRN